MRKATQAHHRAATLALVHMMELYKKNTKISITIRGDGSEILDYSLPHPHDYHRNGDIYTVKYAINGFFNTSKGIAYLNDILARFTLSMTVLDIKITSSSTGGLELSKFQGLKSIIPAKNYEKVDCGLDNVFWSIKLHTEALIKRYGEGKLIAYSLIESYAISNFEDTAKDKSTLKAKCRSIWNWYDNRNWTIPQRTRHLTDKEQLMTRQENAKKLSITKAEKTKAKVQKAIAGLEFMQEKVNIANVARDARVSRNTAKKYMLELGIISPKEPKCTQ